MRLDLHVSPEIYAATKADALARGITQSAAIRLRLNAAYNLPEKFNPRYPRRRLLPQSYLPNTSEEE